MSKFSDKILVDEGSSEIVMNLITSMNISYYQMIYKYICISTSQCDIPLSVYNVTTLYTALYKFFNDEELNGYLFSITSLPNINREYYQIRFSSQPFSDSMEIYFILFHGDDVVNMTQVSLTIEETQELFELIKRCVLNYNPN